MNEFIFLIVYIVILFLSLVYLLYYSKHDRAGYMRVSCKRLESMLENFNIDEDIMEKEIERVYDGYANEMPSVKTVFPNVIMWIDAIIYRIDSKYRCAKKLINYSKDIKKARDVLADKYQFCECNPTQQDILKDINKVRNKDNEALVDNIITRTEKEFLRTIEDIKKNERTNTISMIIGIIGIVVSVLMAIVKI